MSLTKIWIFTLKPPHTSTSNPFTSLWQEVLQFCRARSPPAANHTLWQDTTEPSRIAMLSGYRSQQATDSADARYVKMYAPRMGEVVSHVALYQLAADVGSLPLDGDVLVIRVVEGVGDTSTSDGDADANKNTNMKMETDMGLDMPSDAGGSVVGGFGGEDRVDAKKPPADRKGVFVRLVGIRGWNASPWSGKNVDGDGCTTYVFRKLSL